MSINNGVGRFGIRSYVAPQQITTSTLLNSLYSVWNADTLGTSLDTNLFSVWNAEASNNVTVKNAWNANGNIVDSKSGANGTIATPSGTTFVTGTMSFGTGKLGSGAITFSGTNFVSLPNGTLTFTGDFSASFWIYVPTSFGTNYSRVLSAFDNSAGYTGYKGWDTTYSNGKMSLYIYPGAGTDYYGISVPMTLKDQWVHVTLTKVLGQQGNIYINGVAGVKTVDQRGSGASTQTISYNVSNLAYMGSSYNAFQPPFYVPTVAGGFKIDAIQTWDGAALDQTAVTELYNSGNGQEYPFTLSNALIGTPKDVLGTNHGTSPSGSAPTFTTGKIGNAFTFDGVNDYIQLPSNSLNFTGDFSISGWAYFPTNYSGSSPMYILSNWNVPSWYTNPNGYFLRAYGNEVTFGIFNNGTLYTVTSTYIFQNSVMPASWHHIAATRKGSAASKLYIDGVLVASNTSTINPTYLTTTNPTIGAINVPGNVGSYPAINGSKIDSVSVWNKTLSDDEIVQLYNAGNGTQYPFSSKTLSSSANQLGVDNGTLMNGCTFTDGKIGQAFNFDGVNDYIDLPNNSMNFTGDFSVSGWINQSSIKPYHMIIGNQGTSTGNWHGWLVWVFNNKLTFDLYNGNSGIASGRWQTTTTLSTNTWIHFTITKKPGQAVKIYLDGVINGGLLSGSNSANVTYTTTNYATIGLNKYSNTIVSSDAGYWNGKIDALNVWQKELTQAEVTELYNSGAGKQLTPTPIITNGLVLNLDASRLSSYPNTGTTWFDISGNANNGTLINGAIFGTASGGQITFDGVNDYIDLGTKTTLAPGTTDFTISFWINPNNWGSLSSTSYSPIFVTLVNGGLWIGKNGANFVLRTAYVADDVQYSVLPTVNQWTMVTVNRVGNIAKIYYNGSAVASATVTRNYVSGNSYIGSDVTAGNNYSNVKLSTFSYYNKGLSDSEITQNFNATKSRFGL